MDLLKKNIRLLREDGSTTEQMTLEELTRLREMGQTDYVDVEEVQIDSALPPIERVLDDLEKIKNPYCFLCEKTLVRVVFAEDGTELGTELRKYFLSLKR